MSDDTVLQQREHQWYQFGVKVDNPLTTAEAISLAELDWTVSKRPLYFENAKGDKVKAPARFAVVRDTDDYFMGAVGSHYVPFQNVQAFEFADQLRATDEAAIEACGTMRGQRVVFLVMKLNGEEIMVAGEDAHNLYLLLRTSHDGSKAISAYVIALRMSCTNQMQMATAGATQRWSIPHVSTVAGKLEEAQHALQLSRKYGDEFRATAERLAAIDIELDDFRKLLTHVLPVRPKTPEVIDRITGLFASAPDIENFRGTAWGALNAVTAYYDWGRDTKSPEARFLASVDGVGAVIRNRAAALMLARGR